MNDMACVLKSKDLCFVYVVCAPLILIMIYIIGHRPSQKCKHMRSHARELSSVGGLIQLSLRYKW